MKFNHIFLSVALSAALMGGFTSCDDFLAEDPYAFVGPDQVGNDNAAVNLWVTSALLEWRNSPHRFKLSTDPSGNTKNPLFRFAI